jgi:Uncharacterized protein conserved in bacteria
MKKTFLLIALLFIIFGCSTKATEQFPQTPEEFTGSLLWKISGNGLEKPSYVFGTYHFLGQELLDSVPGLKQAMEETNQVAAEVNPAEMAAAQFKIMGLAMMPEGEGYKDILSEEEYAHLDNALKNNLGAGLDEMGMLTPSMITVSLTFFAFTKLNPDFNPMSFEGIDSYIMRIAGENNKEVIGLETADEQIKLLYESDESMKTQIDALICNLENTDYALESLHSMTENYIKGDIYQIYKDNFDNPNAPCAEFVKQEYIDDMLKNRNDNWMKKLPKILAGNSTLVAVGAGHLANEEGILYQLSQLGYKVEPVK